MLSLGMDPWLCTIYCHGKGLESYMGMGLTGTLQVTHGNGTQICRTSMGMKTDVVGLCAGFRK